MDIRTFEPRLSAAAAASRTDRITLGSYLRGRIESLLGRGRDHEAIYPLYYPDYIAYTTVELRRVARSSRTVKFLVGIDAVTGRVGEVDIELPPRERRDVDGAAVIRPDLDRSDAESEWSEWIFPFLDRKYRPVKRPEYVLDRVELVYVPYWLVDYGTLEGSFVVSGLTKQVESVEAMKPVKGYYEQTLAEAASGADA